MAQLLRLDPPIPVDTPEGKGSAFMVIDYSTEHYLIFAVFLDETGECWMFDNRKVKLQKNYTMGVMVEE